MSQIAFIDLQAQRARLGDKIDSAIQKVLTHGGFIMGPEVREFEARLAEFCGAKHAISCSSGTDALLLPLMAEGVGAGDAVFVPSMTFASTAEVVALLGATPVFCDVLEDTFNMDPASLEAAIAAAKEKGLTPKAVIPVDLFGQPADFESLLPIAEKNGLFVLDDAAQGFGGTVKGKKIGTFGNATATSFFPAKPLGCYGDGGAVLTDDDTLADVMRSLRVHGKGTDKYDNVRVGVNARLDTIQAAILIEKLAIFPDEIEARNRIATRYNELLKDVAVVPVVAEGAVSVWAQYTLKVKDRAALQADIKNRGVPTAVYYPLPLHRQTAYKECPTPSGGLPVSDRLAESVISLPMHPYLDDPTQDRIVEAVRAAAG